MTIVGRDIFCGDVVELGIEDGRIARRRILPERPGGVSPRGEDLPWISPGWIDLQVNGWMGVDYNADALGARDVETLCRRLSAAGTTRHLPTIITASPGDMRGRLARMRRFRDDSPFLSRRIPGYHVEGPFLSADDGPRGAHEQRWIRPASPAEFDDWQAAAGNLVKIVTLAPEVPGALDFIEYVASRGAVPAIGHTAADPIRIREAVAAGARMSTHLGNGIAGTIPRHANALWPQLADDSLTASLIADGHHLPGDALKAFVRAKGAGRFFLVSDAAVPGGTAPGPARWAGTRVTVEASGRIALTGTGYLAGAGHLLDRGLATLHSAAGLSWSESVSACTAVPGGLIGLPSEEWNLAEGSPADIVAFLEPKSGESEVDIRQVFLDGALLGGVR